MLAPLAGSRKSDALTVPSEFLKKMRQLYNPCFEGFHLPCSLEGSGVRALERCVGPGSALPRVTGLATAAGGCFKVGAVRHSEVVLNRIRD